MKTLIITHERYLWGSLLKVRGDVAFEKIYPKCIFEEVWPALTCYYNEDLLFGTTCSSQF